MSERSFLAREMMTMNLPIHTIVVLEAHPIAAMVPN